MKVIFLDFDGVLNCQKYMQEEYAAGRLRNSSTMQNEMVDPKTVSLLNDVIAQTGAVVVVSSTWRILNTKAQLQEILNSKGFKGHIFGCTPRIGRGEISPGVRAERGHEIQEWMDDYTKDHPYAVIDAFVIIDDDSDMAHLLDKLVHTKWETGLLPEHVPAILRHLNPELQAS